MRMQADPVPATLMTVLIGYVPTERNPVAPSCSDQPYKVGIGLLLCPCNPSSATDLNAKHKAPTIGLDSLCATASSLSTVSGANPISVSNHINHSEVPSKNCSTILLRAVGKASPP